MLVTWSPKTETLRMMTSKISILTSMKSIKFSLPILVKIWLEMSVSNFMEISRRSLSNTSWLLISEFSRSPTNNSMSIARPTIFVDPCIEFCLSQIWSTMLVLHQHARSIWNLDQWRGISEPGRLCVQKVSTWLSSPCLVPIMRKFTRGLLPIKRSQSKNMVLINRIFWTISKP